MIENISSLTVGFRFQILVADSKGKLIVEENSIDSSFQEVSGLSVEISTEDIVEGGENRFTHKAPAATKYPNLVLKRGTLSEDSVLVNWCKRVFESGLNGRIECYNLIINLLSAEEMQPLMSWNITKAYPVKWDVSGINAMQNELAIESMEFAYQRFERNLT